MPFAPGQSGNPTGGRKDKAFADALRHMVYQPYPGDGKKIGLPKKPTILQAAVRQLLKNVFEGDTGALNSLMDRLDGKVPQGIQGGDADAPPIKTQDMTLRECARRLGFMLLEAQRQQEEEAEATAKGN